MSNACVGATRYNNKTTRAGMHTVPMVAWRCSALCHSPTLAAGRHTSALLGEASYRHPGLRYEDLIAVFYSAMLA